MGRKATIDDIVLGISGLGLCLLAIVLTTGVSPVFADSAQLVPKGGPIIFPSPPSGNFTLFSDKNVYQVGNTIMIYGKVTPVSQYDFLTIDVRGSEGDRITFDRLEIKPNPDGTFTQAYTIRNDHYCQCQISAIYRQAYGKYTYAAIPIIIYSKDAILHGYFSSGTPNPTGQIQFSISIDKAKYNAVDRILVSAKVTPYDPSYGVTLRIYDPTNYLVYQSRMLPMLNGTITTSVDIMDGGRLDIGTYKVVALYGEYTNVALDEEHTKAITTFYYTDFVPNSITINTLPDFHGLYKGGVVVFTGRVGYIVPPLNNVTIKIIDPLGKIVNVHQVELEPFDLPTYLGRSGRYLDLIHATEPVWSRFGVYTIVASYGLDVNATYKIEYDGAVYSPALVQAAPTPMTGSLQTQIPSWIKNNAGWWAEGKIGDSDFVNGIQYLIEQKIMKIPETKQLSKPNQGIPAWIKNNAKWWSEGQIGDSDFVQGMQYLISNGIIRIS